MMRIRLFAILLLSLSILACSKDDDSDNAAIRFANSTWAFYTEGNNKAYYKYEFNSETSGRFWYYHGTDNTSKTDFTYTTDGKKLKIDYKIYTISTELDENGELKVVGEDATLIYFIENDGENTISGYYQYSMNGGAKRYPFNAVKQK
ncbi:MAG: hypothetical protein J5658_11895 [Prevotella sp.]|nr:hypothetical protein [Prevotella sp.]